MAIHSGHHFWGDLIHWEEEHEDSILGILFILGVAAICIALAWSTGSEATLDTIAEKIYRYPYGN